MCHRYPLKYRVRAISVSINVNAQRAGVAIFCIIIDYLFSDAEAGEDGGEDVVGGDGAGDGAEVVEGFADVLRYKVGGDHAGEGSESSGTRSLSSGEGGIMACIGDHYGVFIECRSP